MKLVVSYDGRDYAGSQRQSGARSVQEELESAAGRLLGEPVEAVFAGRTDRGVHAAGQVVRVPVLLPEQTTERTQRALNATMPRDLAVVSAELCNAGFHPRHDARWREYRYRVITGTRAPLARDKTWFHPRPVDVDVMDVAARQLVGEHNFASFAGGGEGVPWAVRHEAPRGAWRQMLIASVVEIAPWWGEHHGQVLEIRLVADAFLPRMVRTIAGVLAEIGRGERTVDWIDELLAGRDRRLAAETAPPEGLILWKVGYETDEPAL